MQNHTKSNTTTLSAESYASKITAVTFSSLISDPLLLNNISKLAFTSATQIQQQTIPVIKSGGDIIGLAQTGTGKTAAYLLPLLERLIKIPASFKARVLIVVPTRELAQQVSDSARELSQSSHIRICSVFGGVRADRQRSKLKRGCEIVVGCPGRILDLVGQRVLKLDQIETLVLDEADQMLDMGFIEPVKEIVSLLTKRSQSLLFSATMSSAIKRLADEILTQPKHIQVTPVSSPRLLNHSAYTVSNSERENFLVHFLKNKVTDSVIIFTRTKHAAKNLVRSLKQHKIEALELHGNLSQSQRSRAMLSFRTKECQIMVATDIAARGIDISSISHVINYDLPSNHETYIHRTGRTARAEKSGEAISLVAQHDQGRFRRIEKALNLKIARLTLEGFQGRTENNQKNSDKGAAHHHHNGSKSRFNRRPRERRVRERRAHF
jgi:ATP-dependent RNA helicase RhlE